MVIEIWAIVPALDSLEEVKETFWWWWKCFIYPDWMLVTQMCSWFIQLGFVHKFFLALIKNTSEWRCFTEDLKDYIYKKKKKMLKNNSNKSQKLLKIAIRCPSIMICIIFVFYWLKTRWTLWQKSRLMNSAKVSPDVLEVHHLVLEVHHLFLEFSRKVTDK